MTVSNFFYLVYKKEYPTIDNIPTIPLALLLILGNLSPFAMYTAVEHVPVGSAAGLSRTVVMIITPGLAIFVLKERVGLFKFVPIVICTVGTVIMCNMLFSEVSGKSSILETVDTNISIKKNGNISWSGLSETVNSSLELSLHKDTYKANSDSMSSLLYGISLCVTNGISTSIYYVMNKLLADKVNDIMVLSFMISIVGVLLSIGLMCIFEMKDITFPKDQYNLTYLTVHAVLSGAESFSKSAAIYFGSSLIVQIVCTAEVPLKLVCQYFLFPDLQPIESNVYDVIGATIITAGILLSCMLEAASFCNRESGEKEEGEKLLSEKQEKGICCSFY